jgi:outer membrane protein
MVFGQDTNQSLTQSKFSLIDIWQKADSFSKTNLSKKLQIDELTENISDSRAEKLPEFQASGNFEEASNLPIYDKGVFNDPTLHNIIHTRYKVGVDGYLNIYNGNKANIKIEENRVLREIAVYHQQATAADIRFLAAAYFMDLKKNYIFQSLMNKDIDDQEKQLLKIKVLLKNGVILKSDLLRAGLKLSHQRLSLLQINNDIAITNQKLNILIGEPDELIIIPQNIYVLDSLQLKPYSYYLSVLDRTFDNRIVTEENKLSQIRLKNVKSNTALKLGLYANFQYAYPETFLYPYSPNIYSLGTTGIRISFPLSAYYLNIHKQKAASIEVQKQKILKSDINDKVRQRLNESYIRYKEMLTKVEVAKINVNQATENYRIVQNTYFSQTSLITDLLDADVQLLQTQFDLASSEIAAQLQYYQLQNVLGNL